MEKEEKYRFLFFKYIYNLLDLGKYDKELEEKGIEYIKDEYIMSDEEIVCSIVSKYFYLLNELDLSILTEEEMNEFESLIPENLTEKSISFLKRTYPKVLFSIDTIDDELYYGPIGNDDFAAKTSDIAIGLKYDEFGLARGKLREEDEINRNEEIINSVIERIEKSVDEPKVKIIKYNEMYEQLNQEPLGLW